MALVLAAAAAGCSAGLPLEPTSGHRNGRLAAIPGDPGGALLEPGRHVLDLGLDRNPVLYIPSGYDPSTPAPLTVLFHGAGGSANDWGTQYNNPERLGMLLLMMQSYERTWDVLGRTGLDAAAVDRALQMVFERAAIDPAGVAFGGFSDGASYALQLGLRNPDLARHVFAWSPGFAPNARPEPFPRVLVSHGAVDRILPVSGARAIVRSLQAYGYDVTFLEFQGGHEVPPEIVTATFEWLVR